MADTPQIYFTVLTAIGEAKDAKAKALGTAIQFTDMAVGDGNGVLPVPDRNRTALVNQKRRMPLNSLKQDPKNPSQVIAEQIIPEDEGGWWIRELGLYDADGDLCAIGNTPETYKPLLAQGSGRTQVVRMVLLMSSAATVQLKVDPSVVLATRQYVDENDALNAKLSGAKFTGTVEVPTPTKFDVSNKVASMAAVKRAGVSFADYAVVNASRSLTADDIGKLMWIVGSSDPRILSLPTPGSLKARLGDAITIFSVARPCQLSPLAGTSLNYDLPDIPGITIQPGQSLTLVAVTDVTWQIINSTAELGRNADFAALKAQSGYQRLPGGLLLQWMVAQSSSAGFRFYNFPLRFPNGCTGVTGTCTIQKEVFSTVTLDTVGVTGGVCNLAGVPTDSFFFAIAIGF